MKFRLENFDKKITAVLVALTASLAATHANADHFAETMVPVLSGTETAHIIDHWEYQHQVSHNHVVYSDYFKVPLFFLGNPALPRHLVAKNGTQFERIEDPKLGTLVKSPDGLLWTGTLRSGPPVSWVNYNSLMNMDGGNARGLCHLAGAHLPSLKEYQSLVKQLTDKNGNYSNLTAEGKPIFDVEDDVKVDISDRATDGSPLPEKGFVAYMTSTFSHTYHYDVSYFNFDFNGKGVQPRHYTSYGPLIRPDNNLDLSEGAAVSYDSFRARCVVGSLWDAKVSKTTGIAHNPDGSVLMLNHYDADNFCDSQGMRLPTPRELALEAKKYGAKGISETSKDNFIFLKASDLDQNLDELFYNRTGYKQPKGELGQFDFWSSAVSREDYGRAFSLKNPSGAVSSVDTYRQSNLAVRCVAY